MLLAPGGESLESKKGGEGAEGGGGAGDEVEEEDEEPMGRGRWLSCAWVTAESVGHEKLEGNDDSPAFVLLPGGCLLPRPPPPICSPAAAMSSPALVTMAGASYACPDFLHIWTFSSVVLAVSVVLVLELQPASSTPPCERRPRVPPPVPLLIVAAAVEKEDTDDTPTEDEDGDGSGVRAGIASAGARPSMSLYVRGRSVGLKGGIRAVGRTYGLRAGEDDDRFSIIVDCMPGIDDGLC